MEFGKMYELLANVENFETLRANKFMRRRRENIQKSSPYSKELLKYFKEFKVYLEIIVILKSLLFYHSTFKIFIFTHLFEKSAMKFPKTSPPRKITLIYMYIRIVISTKKVPLI